MGKGKGGRNFVDAEGYTLVHKGKGKSWKCVSCGYFHKASTQVCSWCENSRYPQTYSMSSQSSSIPQWSNRWSRRPDFKAHNKIKFKPDRPAAEYKVPTFDIRTPDPDAAPDPNAVSQVLRWLKGKGENEAADSISRAQSVQAASAEQLPKQPWRDWQSAQDKLKGIEGQLQRADENVQYYEDKLNAARDDRDALEQKREELLSIIEDLKPKGVDDQLAAKADHLEKVIRELQESLTSGMPEMGTQRYKFMYDSVFHGVLHNQGQQQHNDDRQAASPAPETPVSPHDAPGISETSKLEQDQVMEGEHNEQHVSSEANLVDKNGFGFNPVGPKRPRTSQPYARPRSSSWDAGTLFTEAPAAKADGAPNH